MTRGWVADAMTTALLAGPDVASQRGHAIVIGASAAGLATARVLADRFARVTVLERHAAPGAHVERHAGSDAQVERHATADEHAASAAGHQPPAARVSIAPHGRYPHVLLEGGGVACERLFPGFAQEAMDASAPVVDRNTVRWWSDGWRVKRRRDTGRRVLGSRALLESIVRARVEQLANVRIEYGVGVEGLVLDGERVVGARLRGDDRVLAADLVVDCSGRGSQLGAWLEAAGFGALPVTEIEVDLCYLALVLRRRPTDLDGAKTLVIQNIAPAMTRLGLALAVENDRWMVVLGGYFGDAPPTDRAGYLAFADSLPVPELAHLLRLGAPISDPLPYRFRSSRRVHCERAQRWPIGLAALGDATCCFNPLYGQGLSVAFMQAEHLGAVLDRHRTLERVAPRVQRELARFTDMAWNIAAGGDLAYPQVVGERPAIGRLIRRYMAKVFRACSVDEEVVDTLFDVTNLVASPARLLRPSLVARVLRAQRRWRQEVPDVQRRMSPVAGARVARDARADL